MKNSFRELVIWQRAFEASIGVHELVRSMPAEDRYSLGRQLLRAALSVHLNIAEGHARHSTKEFIRFLDIARGSCAEVESCLLMTQADGLSEEHAAALIDSYDEIGRLLTASMRTLRARLKSGP